MKALLIACVFATGVASPVLAANARHPYSNIDRRVDAGNPTGDDQVDRLNQQQLDAARGGLGASGMQNPQPMQGQPGWQR
ncbi:MAG TPA: hypothetical protein VE650_21560 [Acetobacteraceae bacterium]|jgi:opacity protein-like surface antigen|nr:hypothetical protein [Acetobacteraceae bacterium]